MQQISPFDAQAAAVGQSCMRPDPFINPGRRSMFEMAAKFRGNCPQTGVQITTPEIPVDCMNPANNPNLLGIGERSSYADYAFGSALETKWCGMAGCDGVNCETCGCMNLRDPCYFKGGRWNQPAGCNRLWFSRDPAAWTSPQDGNINGTIRWG